MLTFVDLTYDSLLEIVRFLALDALSLPIVSKPFSDLLEIPNFWIKFLTGARDQGIPLACPLSLKFDELPLDALKQIGRRTRCREQNWASSKATLIGPATSVSLQDEFTILFIVPATPLVLVRFYLAGPRYGTLSCLDSVTGAVLCTAPPLNTDSKHALLATYVDQQQCLLAIGSLDTQAATETQIVSLEYSSDFQMARMNNLRSFLPPGPPLESGIAFGLSSKLFVYTKRSTEDKKLDIVAIQLTSGTVKVFHTDVLATSDYDVDIQLASDTFYILFDPWSPRYIIRCPTEVLLNDTSLPDNAIVRLARGSSPEGRTLPTSVGRTLAFQQKDYQEITFWQYENNIGSPPDLVHTDTVVINPYRDGRLAMVPSRSGETVIVTEQGSDEGQLVLTLFHLRSLANGSSGSQLMLPPSLDPSTILTFMLEECFGILLILDTSARLWRLPYA
ncbi:hypothetical protein C8J56DRAFT_921434 [Mycena floridula]|nr:hypothetical protein C8J56DRAFT_921434 [Mycena floridula]